MNQHAEHLNQTPFRSKIIVRTRRHRPALGTEYATCACEMVDKQRNANTVQMSSFLRRTTMASAQCKSMLLGLREYCSTASCRERMYTVTECAGVHLSVLLH